MPPAPVPRTPPVCLPVLPSSAAAPDPPCSPVRPRPFPPSAPAPAPPSVATWAPPRPPALAQILLPPHTRPSLPRAPHPMHTPCTSMSPHPDPGPCGVLGCATQVRTMGMPFLLYERKRVINNVSTEVGSVCTKIRFEDASAHWKILYAFLRGTFPPCACP